MSQAALLQRRLATFRRARAAPDGALEGPLFGPTMRPTDLPSGPSIRPDLAVSLAATLGGEVHSTPLGTVVRVHPPPVLLPLDRRRLAGLPWQPPPDVPLICLDTETTGLATAAGTLAFLVGLGWWDGPWFHQVGLLLPDQPDEAALLQAIADLIPPHAWLVTYNGRGFDWPLLVARFRMARRSPPVHAGHLDLLTTVRRLFRHRLEDARLRTVEADLLEIERSDDVEGWEIPARYLGFLRTGRAEDLEVVVRHNERDVRSLALLLAHLASELGDPGRRSVAPDLDLLGLAHGYRREGRIDEALECLELGLNRPLALPTERSGRAPSAASAPWAAWPGERRPFEGRNVLALADAGAARVSRDRLARERARLLRRVGRVGDARAAWIELARRGGPLAAIAWVELAKLLEHVARDFGAALAAVDEASALATRSARLGRPLPVLEGDLAWRRRRLERRRAGLPARSTGSGPRPPSQPSATVQPFRHPLPHG